MRNRGNRNQHPSGSTICDRLEVTLRALIDIGTTFDCDAVNTIKCPGDSRGRDFERGRDEAQKLQQPKLSRKLTYRLESVDSANEMADATLHPTS